MKIYDYWDDIFGELSLSQTHDIIEIKNAKVFLLGGHYVSVTDKQILKLKKHFEKRKQCFSEDWWWFWLRTPKMHMKILNGDNMKIYEHIFTDKKTLEIGSVPYMGR